MVLGLVEKYRVKDVVDGVISIVINKVKIFYGFIKIFDRLMILEIYL